VRDPRRHLPKRCHFLRMHQACLRRLQFAESLLGGVSGCANRFLGMLALRGVAVDQHAKPLPGPGSGELRSPVRSVGPRALETHFAPGIFDGAAQLIFEIGRDVLAAISEIPEILGAIFLLLHCCP
jgi:hypothetical protein